MSYATKTGLLAALASLQLSPAAATVRLPRLVGDHMVLQRDARLPLWGWAAPGEAVTVTFRGKSYPAKTGGPAGKWTLTLPPAPAGGPYELTVRGSNTLVIKDVLLGDVWLASGQSNMEWPLQDAQNGPAAVAAANYPQIRRFDVPNTVAYQPQAELPGGADGWQVCSPQTAGRFSAVAYFFARDLEQRYHVPIGLITSEWGGTVAEAWVSAAGLRPFPEFAGQLATAAQSNYDQRHADWLRSPASRDRGHLPGQPAWTSPALDASAWATMPVPQLWENTDELRGYDGVVWFRKEFTLSAEQARQDLSLRLGTVDDADSTWVNGTLVGSTAGYNVARRYVVPAAALRPGRNVVAVRVVDTGGGGGLTGPAAELQAEAAGAVVPLAGAWQYRPAVDLATEPHNPFPNGAQNVPTALYNGMIAPLLPYAIKGAIWYQGESNAARAEQYRRLFPALITDWRQHWGQGDFPFLFVQLAGFQHDQPQPADYEWAELREAQAQALRLPGTGMAVAIDLGNPNDIHPRNKHDVGRRLALTARRVAYHEAAVVAAGPTFQRLTVLGAQARLSFTNAGAGLVLKDPAGDYLKGFAVAGADQKFHWAQGRLEGNALVLSSPDVPQPVAVRYDWGNTPFANLYNKAGLPAAPFRTDTWPGLTVGKK